MKRLLLSLFVLLFLPSVASAQLSLTAYRDVVLSSTGTPLTTAAITVFAPNTSTKSTIFSTTLGASLGNPFAVDSLGNYTFYAVPGVYDILISVPGLADTTIEDVHLASSSSYFLTGVSTEPSGCGVGGSYYNTTAGLYTLCGAAGLSVPGSSTLTGNITFGGSILPAATGQDIGSAGARPNAFLQDVITGNFNKIRAVEADGEFTTIQAAVDDLPSTGGIVLLPEGNTNISSTLLVIKDNVWLFGRGQGGTDGVTAAKAGATTITWTGAAGEDMILWGNQSTTLQGGGMERVEFQGGGLASGAGRALHVTDVQGWGFQDLFFDNFRDNTITEVMTFDNNLATNVPTGFAVLENIEINLRPGTASHGIGLRGTCGAPCAGVTIAVATNIRINHANGNALNIILGDAWIWNGFFAFRDIAETGFGVDVRPVNASDPVGGHVFIRPLVGNGGFRIETSGGAALDAVQQITMLHYGKADSEPDPTGAGASVNLIVFTGDNRYLGTEFNYDAIVEMRPTGSGNNLPSNQLRLTGRDSGGTERVSAIQGDADGDLRLVALAGRSVLSNGLRHLIESPTYLTDAVANPLEGELSNMPRWILKVVDHTDMAAAATADDFVLWTLPDNTMIHDVVGELVTEWEAAAGLSAAVCSVGTAGGSANDLALDDDFFTTAQTIYELHDGTASGGKGALLFDGTDKFAPFMLIASGDIEIQCDLTGDDHADTNAGQARIQILVSQPLANTTIEAN